MSIAKQHTKDMTQGTPWKLIIGFALPVLLSQVFQQLYNTADAFIVSEFLGDNALAAVSSSGPLIHLLISFFVGTSMGAGIAISRFFGAGDYERVSKAIHTNLVLGVLSGILLTIVGVVFTPTLLRWMNTDPDILPEAVSYFRYYFAGISAVVLYNICKSIMNALGDSKRPLYYLIFSSLTNIVLDLLFIGVFHWGVWAAALATTISQFLSLILCLIHLLKKGTIYQIQLKKLKIDKEMALLILRYGLPSGIQNSVIGLANVIVQSSINAFGKLATAAYGAYSKIEGFAFLPVTSFTMAITTFISQNLGARQHQRAKIGSRFGIFTAMALAEVIGVVIYLFAPTLIGLFSDTPAIVEIGVKQARTVSLFYCLLALSHCIAAVCRGAGKAFVPMTVMLVCWCVIRIAYILTVTHLGFEITAIYWAYPITWSLSSIIYLIYYFCSDWVHGFDKQKQIPA